MLPKSILPIIFFQTGMCFFIFFPHKKEKRILIMKSTTQTQKSDYLNVYSQFCYRENQDKIYLELFCTKNNNSDIRMAKL